MLGNIAIDGPAGSGKSTVARLLAQKINYLYLDTGAMYRALTYQALKEGVELGDPVCLAALAQRTVLAVALAPGEATRVFCNGEEVTARLRDPVVSRNVSLVARVPAVRQVLVAKQREEAKKGKVILEGRDTGTFVLPEAPYKFFLTASLEARTKRRGLELLEQGYLVNWELLRAEICARDRLDTEREMGPLKPAPDAICIDTSHLLPEAVVSKITAILQERCPCFTNLQS